MTVYDKIKENINDIDIVIEMIDKYGTFDNSPWIKWYDENYCSKCIAEMVTVLAFNNQEVQCSWCELYNKCKFFQDKNKIPDNKEMIKMWLESTV